MSNGNDSRDAMTMPADEELLEPLGRVTWAAARLHSGVRDAINHIEGVASDAPFALTLGSAVARLETLGRGLTEPHATAVAVWCRDVGRPAVRARNQVVHAVTFTASDGRQAIGTHDHSAPGRFLREELLAVTDQLVDASRRVPGAP